MKKRKRVLNIIIAGLILYGFSACGSGLGGIDPEDPATSKELTAFSFTAAANTELSADVIGAISGTTITATVPSGTDVTALVATFSTTGVSVNVGAAIQTSGITTNDFTGSVTYTVTAEDLSTQDYTVTVAITANTKELIAFSFTAATNTELSADVTGAISSTTITATVPFGANVTALVATFSTTGISVKVGDIVQTTGITANDFTGSVTYTVTAEDLSTQDYTITVGNLANHMAGSVSFNMAYVPGMSFPTALDDSGTATVSNAYFIGETEVTYELWSAVYTWATTIGGYIFANPGVMGDGTGDTDQHPVTTINWRDAMVWMNALTEYSNVTNGIGLEAVYYADLGYIAPIKDSRDETCGGVDTTPGSCDNPYVKFDANGFRLPTENEWKLAARYKGTDSANGAIEYPASSGNWWTPGNYASGATANYNNASATAAVAVYGVSSSAEVKSKTANVLGLYDMSGNVWEWSFEWSTSGSNRVCRGGGYSNFANGMRVGNVIQDIPYSVGTLIGFRLSRIP